MAADNPDAPGERNESRPAAIESDESPDVPHPEFERYAAEPIPQASVGAPGKDGRLELRFAPGRDGTNLVYDYATVPFHVSGTLGHDPHPDAKTVFVQSPTGGIAQGDRHDVTITVDPEAIATVSTGSSTKVQTMTCNYAAADVTLSVETGGHLDYVPEPTILHEGARYCEETTLSVAGDATTILSDVVVPGRLARGERFEFEQYFARIRAKGPAGLLFEDTTHLTPGTSDPTTPGVLGEFPVYGTAFVVAPEAATARMSDDLHAIVGDAPAHAGATELPNGAGVVVRALGDRAETVRATLHAARDHARRNVLDAPAPSRRKY